MISDFVKGKKQYEYPVEIQKGIRLHREIDRFTDLHPVVKEAKELFRPDYRLYCSAFIDVVFDHFLANDNNEFPGDSLGFFTEETYQHLDKYSESFPEKFAVMFPYMKAQNWLYHYRFPEGIEKSMGGLARKSLYITETKTAFRLFTGNYLLLKNYYEEFFPALKEFAIKNYEALLSG